MKLKNQENKNLTNMAIKRKALFLTRQIIENTREFLGIS